MASGLREARTFAGGLRLVLSNTLDAVEAGRVPLVAYAERCGVGARAVNRLEVIFEELVSNAIRHGFTPGSDQTVQVWAKAGQGAIELTFEDDGDPFNLLERPAPLAPSSIEDAALGGLGVALVLRLAASVRYEQPAPAPASARFRPRNRIVVTLAA